MNQNFLFATGIENSTPTIKNGKERVDELEKCGHYQNMEKDFDLVKEMGINFLRYGPPLHKTFLSQNHFDWSFTDEAFRNIQQRKIIPIVDLCHFGVPDWIGNFQ